MKWVISKLLVLIAAVTTGCSSDIEHIESDYIYVPGPDLFQSLTISASPLKVRAGEEIVLLAERKSEGFVRIKTSEFKGGCYFLDKPPYEELDVALNLTWFVDLESSKYRFDINDAGNRTLKIFQSGEFHIRARSALWCPPGIDSNRISVLVE